MSAANIEKRQNLLQIKDSVFDIINVKIQYADFQLKNFMKSLMKNNQTPSRALGIDSSSIEKQKDIFRVIENSSSYTTKLLYLRANLTDSNSKKVLKLLTDSQVKFIPLHQIKETINR